MVRQEAGGGTKPQCLVHSQFLAHPSIVEVPAGVRFTSSKVSISGQSFEAEVWALHYESGNGSDDMAASGKAAGGGRYRAPNISIGCQRTRSKRHRLVGGTRAKIFHNLGGANIVPKLSEITNPMPATAYVRRRSQG